MNGLDLIQLYAAGGFFGLCGQLFRAAAGLMKVSEAAASNGQKTLDVFSWSQFLISLLLGFCAGLAATFSLASGVKHFVFDNTSMSTVFAAGYAGSDFLQAVLAKTPLAPRVGAGSPGPGAPTLPPMG